MKASSRLHGWRPLVGVLAVGALAFGWGMKGAAAPKPLSSNSIQPNKGGSESADRAVVPTVKDNAAVKARGVEGRVSLEGAQRVPEFAGAPITHNVPNNGHFGRVLRSEIPIVPVEIVNPYDDEFTRARQQGIELDRRTGLPVGAGGVASAQTACSFDIDCDDCDPCTSDFCNIQPGQPLGSGTCVNTPLPDGADGDCGDGLCCNGRETCQNHVCVSNSGTFDPTACEFPCTGGELCDEFDNLCKPACVTNANCNDGLFCDGTETCSTGAPGDPPAGVCKRGTNPCGDASATCGEHRCSILANNPPFCTTDADCTGGGNCTINGPICYPGRCCVGSPEPTCSRRAFGINYRGIFPCTTGTGNVGGVWYPGDQCDLTTAVCTEGDLIPGVGDPTCPTGASPAGSVKCPKYGAGIAPITSFTTDVALVVGPFSRSATCDHFDIGDDYTFSNNSYMAIDHLRWIGAGGARLVWEFRDASGNLIEDAVTLGVSNVLAIRTLLINPPITIPPHGYLVVRPAPQFAPNGRTFVTAVDSVDIGSNDSNALWYDGAIRATTKKCSGGPTPGVACSIDGDCGTGGRCLPFISECVGGVNDGGWCDPTQNGSDCPLGVCTARNQILAIELEGVKTGEPLGACCNHVGGTCSGNDRWICEGNNGSFLGEGSFCNSCSSPGSTNSANCSRCVGGTNNGAACQRNSDCNSNNCAANATVCLNRCTGGANNGAPCLVNSDCASNVCTIGDPGNAGATCVSNATCGTGACCNSITGNCTLTTQVGCVGGTFEGFGTDCDADNGHDNGKQSCCHKPTATGADNCGGVTVNQLHVAGTTALDPAVVTISGDNSAATGQDTCGDAIFDITAGPGADPGWWEAFSVDGCAFVRVDFCCSDPTVEPQWSFMYTGCPCNTVIANAVDPNQTSEGAVSRGKPYCLNDDNLWIKYGPLPAGTYYIPVYSVLAGHHGPYQMHVSAYGCPNAACCTGANCQVTNFLNCEQTLQGTYLGPPNLPTSTTTCDNTPVTGTCGTGSCCTLPGVCKDQIPDSGPKATQAACLGLSGTPVYHGGIRCKGGTCSNDANRSCNSDADCPGGGCVGSAQQIAQQSPCPACDIEDNDHCQKVGNPPANERLSDYCVADCVATPANGGLFVADDFTATVSGNLTKVCFAGAFLDQDTGLGDCSGSNPPELFEVAIYGDHGVPNENNLIGRTATHVIAKSQKGIAFGSPYYEWSVSLDNQIALVSGTTYWISVINNTNKNFGGTPGCDWFWAYSDVSDGNHYWVSGQDQNWTAADVLTGNDESFCLNINNAVPPVPTKACCNCITFPDPSGSDPHCKDLNAEDCASVHGDWLFTVNTCGNTVCQGAGFAGDNCSAAIPATGNAYSAPFNNFCANTDGPVNLTCEGAATRFGGDVWYKYTATCTGSLMVETCDDAGEFDTVMAVYHDNANPNTCVCPPPNNQFQFGDCNDDGCVFNGAGSQIVPFNVVAGECYTIRVAGFQNAQGHGTVSATCTGGGGGPPDVTPVPGEDNKVRYLGMIVPPFNVAAGETAIEVKLVSLMHPDPPNLQQYPPPNYTAFEGQVRWVGPVAQCVESQAPPATFNCAPLVCSPHYENFNATTSGGPLYVAGAELTPSSSFTVTQYAGSCLGNEGTCSAKSAGTPFKTQRWGDVANPYQLPSPNPLTQPNIGDISAIVDKFKNVANAPIVARSDLVPNAPNNAVNIADVSGCVDAFKNFAYVFAGPCACPSTATCPATDACGRCHP